MWKITSNDLEEVEVPEADELIEPEEPEEPESPPTAPQLRYKVLKEVTYIHQRFHIGEFIPDGLIPQDSINSLLRKGAIEKVEG